MTYEQMLLNELRDAEIEIGRLRTENAALRLRQTPPRLLLVADEQGLTALDKR